MLLRSVEGAHGILGAEHAHLDHSAEVMLDTMALFDETTQSTFGIWGASVDPDATLTRRGIYSLAR